MERLPHSWSRSAAAPSDLAARLARSFADAFGPGPVSVSVAPGRVNLIGDHTDYNDGFVLPMAIDRFVVATFRRRDDRRLRALAVEFDETREVDLDDLGTARGQGWLSYVAGVAWSLQAAGFQPPGLDVAIGSTVPVGAGLSSSAAIELAIARAFVGAAGGSWDPVRQALIAQRAENDFVGMQCGIMDQYAIACAQEGAALLLDCRTLEATPVPIPAEVSFVVMDTGAPRSLVGSAFNQRRESCRRAVDVLWEAAPGIRALRDVDAALLERAKDRLGEVTFKRARHVVAEIRRPAQFAEALGRGDVRDAGRLMNASHESLRDDYGVSSPELDVMTDFARQQPMCFGARLTGAGFGGCAVAMVDAARVDEFVTAVGAAYRERTRITRSAFYPCRPVGGVRLLG